MELWARWTGTGWESRAVDGAPVFFFHRIAHTYDREGHHLVGPASRDLDRFPVRVTGTTAVVDTATIMPGASRATEGAECYP